MAQGSIKRDVNNTSTVRQRFDPAREDNFMKEVHSAALKEDVEMVNAMVKDFESYFSKINGKTILHDAISKGHTSLVRLLVTKYKGDLNVRGSNGDTPLTCAGLGGSSVECVELLINKLHCDINTMGAYGRTILHHACYKGHTSLVRLLVTKYKGDLKAPDSNGDTPFTCAGLGGSTLECVELLINEFHCDINTKGAVGRTILHNACYKGHTSLVRQLVTKYKCELKASDSEGSTPFTCAGLGGSTLECVELLINEFHCDINTKGAVGRTILHNACYKGHTSLVRQLVTKYKCELKASDSEGSTPFTCAGLGGSTSECVEVLINEFHCDINTKGAYGRTILHHTCYKGHTSLVRLLVTKYKGDLKAPDSNGDTPFTCAGLGGSTLECVEVLINEFHCDINTKGAYGRTTLHHTCYKGHTSLVRLLVTKYKGDLKAPDSNGDTPFTCAGLGGSTLECVELLINEFHCDINTKGAYGRTILHNACYKGHTSLMRLLVTKYKCDLKAPDSNGDTPLTCAGLGGSTLECVELLINEFHCDINTKGAYGRTILHNACYYGHTSLVRLLVTKYKCDLKASDSEGNTPFTCAGLGGSSVECVELLINEFHCDINTKGAVGRTILHNAFGKGHTSLVRLLVTKYKCDLKAPDSNGDTPFTCAGLGGSTLECVELLINEFHCDINTKGAYGRTILHNACYKGHTSLVRLLVTKYKCDLKAPDSNGDTPLTCAGLGGSTSECVEVLINEFRCDINTTGAIGRTILHNACYYGHTSLVRLLVTKYKGDLKAPDSNGDTPFTCAGLGGSTLECVEVLINEFHCDINTKGAYGRTILHNACYQGHISLVRLLVTKYKGDLKASDSEGNTPFTCAGLGGSSVECVELLINEFHCDINTKGAYGGTILHKACYQGHTSLMRLLVTKYKCDLKAPDSNGDTPLTCAGLGGSTLECVELLINEFHCDINTKGAYGRTILHNACYYGHTSLVRLLVTKYKCDLKASDSEGNTPFTCAGIGGSSVECVELLINEFHCDINTKGAVGRTILHKACYKGHTSLVRLLVTKYKGDLKAPDSNGDTPFTCAGLGGSTLECVELLINEFHCDINTKGAYGRIILHYACYYGHTSLVRQLVTKYKGDLKAPDSNGDTPLTCAGLGGSSVECVELLINEFHCDINTKGAYGRTILHYACEKGHTSLARLLVTKYKSGLKAPDSNGDTPFTCAGLGGSSVECVELLINEFHCDINTKGAYGRTILHNACYIGHTSLVRLLVTKYKCDIKASDSEGNTPFTCAGLGGSSVECVELLINEFHCDINTKGAYGRTILHKACYKGHISLVRLLVTKYKCDLKASDSNGDTHFTCAGLGGSTLECVELLINEFHCDINTKGAYGRTVLHNACYKGHTSLVRLLVTKYKCNLKAFDSEGNTPFTCAGLGGSSVECMELLINVFHCDINTKGAYGRTILHNACYKGHTSLVRLLVTKYKCDLKVPDSKGDTPFTCAGQGGSAECVELLINESSIGLSTQALIGVLRNAFIKGHIGLLKLLVIKYGCDLRVCSGFGCAASKKVVEWMKDASNGKPGRKYLII